MAWSVRKQVFAWCATGLGLVALEESSVAQGRDNNRPLDQDTIKRLEAVIPSVKDSLKSGNPNSQKAALTLLADLPPALVARADMGPAIRNLLESKPADPEIVNMALRAFGKSYPLPAEIDKTFKLFDGSTDPAVQQGLAEAATGLVTSAVPSSKSVRNAKPYADIAATVMPYLSNSLNGARPATRVTGLKGYQSIGTSLADIFTFESNPSRELFPDEVKPKTDRWEPLFPILKKLDTELPKLAGVLADQDATARLTAIQVVESFGNARKAAVAADPGITSFGTKGFEPLVPKLASCLQDSDPVIRMAAIEALDPLGGGLVHVGALIPATSDSVLPVRWAAVRALGKIAPANGTGKDSAAAVEALAKLANDPDVDLRSAALVALQRYGAAAKAANSEIVRAVTTGDVECRIIAMRTLVAVKLDPVDAVPALVPALEDDIRLARAAAVALGRYGPPAKSAVPSLRKALSSTDQELRLAAGEALLLIENPKKPKDD
ncbi:HEAT repeat domain-containing protein [Zavarzinella formosa]|uniref:HEAT repeat domain-containing protein n=1 Tax=Zavarzinella formosa TaxID=360055 RepID=UPI0002DB073B|nr:HEAT repeat domain-containing protein [Zavarzinella formosa]